MKTTIKIMIEPLLKQFIETLVVEYDLKEDDILGMWKRNMDNYNNAKSIKVEKLRKRCAENNLDYKKKKPELLEQLFPYIRESVLETFIQMFMSEYDVDEPELRKLASSFTDLEQMISYDSLSIAQLRELCKSKELAVSGTRAVLVNRLKGLKTTQPKKKIKKVLQYLQLQSETIHIRRNIHNNYEHPETGLIFDPERELVIGKQHNETVLKLTADDVRLCKEYGFEYDIPDNLT
jgi:hypothetical protein